MPFDTLAAVLVAIGFLVPGFILSSVLAATFRRRALSAADLTLQYLALSCFNHGLWSWLIVLIIEGQWLHRHPVATAFLVFVILFLSPLGLGLCAATLSKHRLVRGVLTAVGFKIHRFIPTAWDFRFEQEQQSWMIVRLRDGSTVYGYWGPESFAGDDPNERDLYLEAVFTAGGDDAWRPVPDTDGILIRAGEIATVEFRRIATQTGAP